MSGFELKVWRRGMNWTQERAAEELGVVIRTYQGWESRKEIPKLVALATKALSLSEFSTALSQISTIARH